MFHRVAEGKDIVAYRRWVASSATNSYNDLTYYSNAR